MSNQTSDMFLDSAIDRLTRLMNANIEFRKKLRDDISYLKSQRQLDESLMWLATATIESARAAITDLEKHKLINPTK